MNNNKKACIGCGLYAAVCCLIFAAGIFVNRAYFESLAYDSVVSYQCRQAAAVALLFLIGALFLIGIREALSVSWMMLFAFPVGICLWVFPSLLQLLIGIPYTFAGTALCIAAILGVLFFCRGRRRLTDRREDAAPAGSDSVRSEALPFVLFFLGSAFLVSSGFLYVFLSYDSFFYFTNYGNTLTIVKNFRDIVGDNSYTLTNITQFLPLLNSYTSFWGLDQCFQVQAFLTIDLLACFFWGLYKSGVHRPQARGRLAFYGALMTVFLMTSTSFLVASTWILANMYCMAYLFFVMLLLEPSFSAAQKESRLLAALFFAALTLLRKDGIVFVCFFLVYIVIKSDWKRRALLFVFLPSVVFESWWLFYVRVVLRATVKRAAYTSIANNANIAFVIALVTATSVYLFVLHPILQKRLPFSETWLIYAGMAFLLAALTVRDWNQVVDNVDMTIRNMFLYPAAWGISGIFFGILLTATFLYRPFWDDETFLWAGYIVLNFISYCAVGKELWVNWDDSYSRIILQIVPVFVFISAKKLFSLLQLYTPDRSSGS